MLQHVQTALMIILISDSQVYSSIACLKRWFSVHCLCSLRYFSSWKEFSSDSRSCSAHSCLCCVSACCKFRTCCWHSCSGFTLSALSPLFPLRCCRWCCTVLSRLCSASVLKRSELYLVASLLFEKSLFLALMRCLSFSL